MAKNQKPLKIVVVDGDLLAMREVQALQDKGHEMEYIPVGVCDVVIGSRAWRIDPALGNLEAQLDMMEKGVRNVKYPKSKKDK